jgi:hypothetical protein
MTHAMRKFLILKVPREKSTAGRVIDKLRGSISNLKRLPIRIRAVPKAIYPFRRVVDDLEAAKSRKIPDKQAKAAMVV